MPGKVIEINTKEQWAIIDCMGVKNKVYTPLVTEQIAPGDFLMAHAGYAIGKIDVEEAEETLKLLEEISRNA
ncbi:MAG TPA: HypC/HybG/HupF family hydrogenase formation chaperone [Syntrophorhabdus aromaticivorans]|nr:HypC/HybG/HupF family hydrogenase formation chaperone [Syntrophorhabdus aromaticivorans]